MFILLLVFLSQQVANQPQIELKQEFLRGKALLLPDISLVGDIVNQSIIERKFKNDFMIREFELGIQGYIHPKIRIDVFASAHMGTEHKDDTEHGKDDTEHKHDTGHGSGLNFEEGYITFLQIIGPLGGRLGRKYTDFGKFNPLHPEQWLYVDIPDVLQKSFGEENLIGDGGNIFLNLPAPFATFRIEGGVWRKFTGPFEDVFYSGRLFSSFSVEEFSEIHIGLSSVAGILVENSERKLSSFTGMDVSFIRATPKDKIQFITEPIIKIRESLEFLGLYSSLFYSNPRWQGGLRFDFLNRELIGLNPIFSLLITETTKFRIQYGIKFLSSHGEEDHSEEISTKHIIFLQFIFAIGPHGHVLQF